MDSDVKVYCKNCKNFIEYACSETGYTRYCNILTTINYEYSPVYGRLRRIQSIQDNFNLNKNFNCKYYKRKWWKFWIKD